MNKELLEVLTQKSRELMEVDRLYHDFAHAKNVLKNAQYLVGKLGGDEDVVYTAALFHDIARDKDNHEVEGAKQLREILTNLADFPADKIEETCLAVERHEKGQVTLNEKILSDADKIDAFNILGIGRGFMMQAVRGKKLREAVLSYLELLEMWYKGFYFEESREYVKQDYAKVKGILDEMKFTYT